MNTATPAELSGDFAIGYVNSMGFKSYGMHKHKYCELLFVIDGDLNFLAEDKIYHSSGSCLIFFKENRLHTTEITDGSNYERYNLYFRQKYISEIVPFELIREVYDNDCAVIPLTESEKNELLPIFEQMQKCERMQKYREIEKAISVHLLCSVLLKAATLIKEKFNPESHNIDSYISEVVAYINENLKSKLVIEEMASMFFVSRAKLISDFKKTTGVTIGDYILTRRIRLSKELIRSGMKISEVAEQSGFGNACHFIRTFKKVTGKTPLQYRNT